MLDLPGNATDQVIIRIIKDDLAGWILNRVVWIADRGFSKNVCSEATPSITVAANMQPVLNACIASWR